MPAVSANVLRHREKVLAHAEGKLRTKGKLNSPEHLALYKKFLKIENHRLRLKHHSGGGGREVCRLRATLIDIILRHLLTSAIEASGEASGNHGPVELAIVAVGGYGRGELNPFSDVDIMFLHSDARSIDPRINETVQAILYMLWDIGFKVGHSTRSIATAIKHANSDMQSKTALLEARFVAGDEKLFEEFRTRFVADCVEPHVEQYIRERIENQADRHGKFGHSVYMQEPNVKNGCGGLRDYQNLLWMAYFKERVKDTAGLVEKKLIDDHERRMLDKAYDFLLRVRTELHYLNKRSMDSIPLGQQLQLSNRLGYTEKNILRRTEAFMRDYYQHARNIFNLTELVCERLALKQPEPSKVGGLLGFLRKRKPPKVERFDGFYSLEGRLYPDSSNIFKEDPARMMRMFLHMQQRRLRMSPELQQLVRRKVRQVVDRTFQYSKTARETFMEICSHKGDVGEILRAMHQVDFLGQYLPEFGQLTCLVQHEFFHRYTADEHTLVCIEKLDHLIDTQDPKLSGYREVFQKLSDPFVLYLALLLHDTGKAANVRHHEEASTLYAQKVARRLQLSPERRRTLIILVDNHIALSMTAQRRNIEDPETIKEFAVLVKSQDNLDALMLLTLADGQGVGDENWSDWKESLVWQLYRNTSLYLADGAAFYRQRNIEREEIRKAVRRKLSAEYEDEIDAQFEGMPERYFHSYSALEIVEHIRLFRDFLAARFTGDRPALAMAVKWIPHPNRGHTEIWFCGWDRHELLARIAGSISCAGLNILSADIFTRTDHLVLDIFRVCTTKFEAVTEPRDIATVENLLHQSLETEDYDFTPQLTKAIKRGGWQLAQELDFPTRMAVDNETHPSYTLVDIQMPDRLGLLYQLLRAFGQEGVSIAFSRIATEKGAAIDSFYVTDADGRKLRSEEQIARLQQVIGRIASGMGPHKNA